MIKCVFKNSTCLREISHDGIAMASVRFTSNPDIIYQYYPVTGAQVQRIVGADSSGEMFHEEIRRNKSIEMVRKIKS